VNLDTCWAAFCTLYDCPDGKHERYDGLGYPDGLAGEAIPVEARIVCC